MKNRLELGRRKAAMVPLPKAATGIQGLDEITHGGFPKGRPSLVCGSAGSGKTLLAMEFLVRGALQFDEPGVFVSFEEDIKDLIENVASLGFDLDALIANRKLVIDYVRVQESEIKEAGAYDLEGLFIRLNYAIDSIGATRVVLDTIETLFSGLSNHHLLRGELRRLFGWLKEKGVTTIITCEKGDGTLTRHGLEEYVADCVVALDHRVTEQISTRRIRVVKYRGSEHGTNEYPFLIDETGFSVFPNNSIGLNHVASDERVVSGIPRLDAMLGGQGYYRGSSVLISGTAGTGKNDRRSPSGKRSVQEGRTMPLSCFGGVRGADYPQRPLDRNRPGTVRGQRASSFQRRQANRFRSRNAPLRCEQADRGFPAIYRSHRSHNRLD